MEWSLRLKWRRAIKNEFEACQILEAERGWAGCQKC